ncbi:MAG: DUF2145 domain-containing protein [Desulfobacterales bacterium]|nr:DUF2145 domain-containing protein [Desulfobacterales bacterium]
MLISALPAFAGSSQADGKTYFEADQVIKFAKKLEKTLAAKGAHVAITARVGRPRKYLPGGVYYTHTAFAVYSKITTADGRNISGYSIYNLYQRNKEPDVSDLKQDFPVDFTAGCQLLETGVIIPTPDLQKRLLNVIASQTYQRLHNPKYSVIANPFTSDFQNCTEFVLDIITAAIYRTDNIRQIKANERAYFEPHPVNVNPVKLRLGSIFAKGVKLSDHKGSPATATFTTIGGFLKKFNMASEIITVTAEE